MNTESFNRTFTALRLSELASTFSVSDDGPPVSSPILVADAVKHAAVLTVVQIDSSGRLIEATPVSVANPTDDAQHTVQAVVGVLLPSTVSVLVAYPQQQDVSLSQHMRFATILACQLTSFDVSLIDCLLTSVSGSQSYSMLSSGTA